MLISKNFLSFFFPEIDQYSEKELEQAFIEIGLDLKYEKIIEPKFLFYGRINSCILLENLKKKIWKCSVYVPLKKQEFQILCGAENVRKDLNVVLALEGSRLFNDQVLIKKKVLYGQISEGMICGYYELYKSDLLQNKGSELGIIELPDQWDLSKEFSSKDLGLDDLIFSFPAPVKKKLRYSLGLSRELKKHLPEKTKTQKFFTNFLIRWILINNDLIPTKYPEKNWKLFLYKLTGQIYCREKGFLDQAQIGKNLLSSDWTNLKLREYIKEGLSGQELFKFLEELKEKNFYNSHLSSNIDAQEILSFFNIKASPEDTVENTEKSFIKNIERCNILFKNGEFLIPELFFSELSIKENLIEEIATVINLSEIQSEKPELNFLGKNDQVLSLEEVKSFWSQKGFFQCNTFNLQSKEEGESSNIFELPLTEVENFFSKKHQLLRTHGLIELAKISEDDHSHRQKLIPFFELCYINCLNKNSSYLDKNSSEKREKYHILSFVHPKVEYSLLRTHIQDFYANFGLQKIEFKLAEEEKYSKIFKKVYRIYSAETFLGFFGTLNKELELYGAALLIPKERLFSAKKSLPFQEKKDTLSIREYSKFPPAFRDISIDITNFPALDPKIFLSVKKRCKFLEEYEVIDSYSTENLKSITIRFKFQSYQKTLTKLEIDQDMKLLLERIISLGLKVR